MSKNLFKGKSTRTKLFTVITAAVSVLLLALNLALTYIGGRYNVFSDMTREGFYTLSDKMKETCEAILESRNEDGSYRLTNDVKITFCDDPDNLVASKDMRPAYFMAMDIMNKYDNFKVETVNVRTNPAAVAAYKTTSLDTISTTDVIVSYGAKYRVIDGDWWTGTYFSYDGEYILASVMASLTAISQPAVYFTVGHGETVFDANDAESEESLSLAAFADLLFGCGFKIKLIDLSELDEVPEDCTLLIINDPREDFIPDAGELDRFDYVSELEKIDRYMVRGSGALMLNKDYTVDLPELESYAYEWGLAFGDVQVRDPDSAVGNSSASYPELFGTEIIATYDTGEYTLGAAYYGDYAALSSAPKMVFKDTGYLYCGFNDGEVDSEPGNFNIQKTYSRFIGTTDTATGWAGEGSSLKLVDEGKKALAAMTVRVDLDSYDGEKEYSYFFATNTNDFLSNDLLENRSYANNDILTNLVQNISRTETHASIELGGTSYNSTSFGGKQSVSTTLTETAEKYYAGDGTLLGSTKAFTVSERNIYTVICLIVPALVLVFGIITYIRRKFL